MTRELLLNSLNRLIEGEFPIEEIAQYASEPFDPTGALSHLTGYWLTRQKLLNSVSEFGIRRYCVGYLIKVSGVSGHGYLSTIS